MTPNVRHRRLACAVGALACIVCCATVAARAEPAALPLSYFETQIDGSPELGAAGAVVTGAGASEQAARDRAGTQAFATNGFGPERSVVTNTSSRSYFRYEQEFGLRFPVLGSRALQQQDIVTASADDRLARLTFEDTRLQLLASVRQNYVSYRAARQTETIAASFVADLERERASAQALRRSGFWTRADVLTFEDLLGKARLDTVQARLDQQSALQRLSVAVNANVAPFATVAPTYAQCAPAPDAVVSAAIAADVALAKIDVEHDRAAQLAELAPQMGYEASIDVGVRASDDLPGGLGYGLTAGASVGVPLHIHEVRADEDRYFAAQLLQYDLLGRQRRLEITAGIETALEARAQAAALLGEARQYEGVLQEEAREARVRMRFIEPSTMTDVLAKEQDAYKARVAVATDEALLLQRINDLLLIAPAACEASGTAPKEGKTS